MRKTKAIDAFQLMCAVTATLFIAGVVVPGLLSRMVETQEGVAGSLHLMKVAGVTFTFRVQNILFAVLGTAFGSAVALAVLAYSAKTENADESLDPLVILTAKSGTTAPPEQPSLGDMVPLSSNPARRRAVLSKNL